MQSQSDDQLIVANRSHNRIVAHYSTRLGASDELRPRDVAAALEVSLSLVYAYMKLGLIKTAKRRAGARYCSMVNRESVLDFIASRSTGRHTVS
jgi:hypothetical protein